MTPQSRTNNRNTAASVAFRSLLFGCVIARKKAFFTHIQSGQNQAGQPNAVETILIQRVKSGRLKFRRVRSFAKCWTVSSNGPEKTSQSGGQVPASLTSS